MDRITNAARAPRNRVGLTIRLVAMVLSVLMVFLFVAWRFLPGMSRGASDDMPMLHVVEKSEFVHDITERGSVESASNIEVRCEVQAQNSAGTRILEIVPEGTNVKAGDVICKLDSSALENDRLKQTSVVENANAAMIQADSDHQTAVKALDEYLKGKYKIEKAQIEGEIDQAKEASRRAEENVRYSKRLMEKGYITQMQLQADEFAATKAASDRKAAELKLTVLDDYTRKKTEVQLNADIKSTAAKFEAQKSTWQLEKQRLELIVKQIEKCTITAPANGQVVYANNTERFGGQEIIIEEGAVVRERQVIVRLPDPNRMQVKARINESKIALVRENQPAIIRLDALPDQDLQGVVRKVNEYPVQGGWWAANIKEYETTVEILGSPAGLRPGLNAEVRIRVAHLPDVVQVPVQAVLTHGDKHYCFVRKNDDWEPREVAVGITNDKMLVVTGNLQSSETVAVNAASLRDDYELPPLAPTPPSKFMLAANLPSDAASGKAEAVPPGGPERPGAKGRPREAGQPGPSPGNVAAQTPGKKRDPLAMAAEKFKELDKDGDGRLSKSEVPEPMRAQFTTADKNSDGYIDRQEWLAAMPRVAASGPGQKPKTRGG